MTGTGPVNNSFVGKSDEKPGNCIKKKLTEIRQALRKNMGLFGNFPQTSDLPPPFWEFQPFLSNFWSCWKILVNFRWFKGVLRAMFRITVVLGIGKNSQIIQYFFLIAYLTYTHSLQYKKVSKMKIIWFVIWLLLFQMIYDVLVTKIGILQ